ncbi:hypothetical protein [Allorhizocola rhizosphaerae]|uniref:hypothetical protein n=1 Tax=Allorhizocola rhizosphaerae TaxID=1872709 RepID=UPI000E3EAC25|nr:hypothetical protein [Allorhizocola rhizosphaerae]
MGNGNASDEEVAKMMPELDEPFGRRRWDPLESVTQPLMGETGSQPEPGADGEGGQPSAGSAATSS